MSQAGNQSVSASANSAVPAQLQGHEFTSENQPARKPRRRKDPLSEALNDYLTSRLSPGSDGVDRPPANVLQKYNTKTRRIVETLIDLASGDYTHFPGVTPKAALSATSAAQREVWQRMAGRPHVALQLDMGDGVIEGIELVDRGKDVPLPLTAAERDGGAARGPRALPSSL